MPLDLSSFKVSKGTGNNSTPFDNFVQAVEDSWNNIGDTSKGGFAPGLVFDPAQIQQNAAASGDWLAWSGTDFAPATPPVGVASVIGDQILNAPTATITFGSIPGTFKHLFLHMHSRTDKASGYSDPRIRFNGDSAANYDDYHVEPSGTTPTFAVAEHIAGTGMLWNNVVATSGFPANVFTDGLLWFPHYAGAANNKMIHGHFAIKKDVTTGNVKVSHVMGCWRSNVAVTQIVIIEDIGANYVSGSRFTLYGI